MACFESNQNRVMGRRQERDRDVVAGRKMQKIEELDRKMVLDSGMQENMTHGRSSSSMQDLIL